jgi:hypothetical protein
MKTLAEAIVSSHTPLYSHQLIARGGLECLALAHWLTERGIGARERVRRSLNERIQSAYEQSRLPDLLNPEPDRQRAPARRDGPRIRAHGIEEGNPEAPRPTAALDQPTNSATARQRPARRGRVLMGVGDRSWNNLGSGRRVEKPANPSDAPVVTAMLTISVQSLATPAVILIAAHRTTYGQFIGYMGWDDPSWLEASGTFWQQVGSYLQAVNAAQ